MSDIERVPNQYARDEAAKFVQAVTAIDIERQRAITEVQAAITVARQFPRDPRQSMDLIITECTLPELAEEATYSYARGGTDIVGPSIRLAEVVARGWGNMEFGVRELTRHEGVDGHPGISDCQAYAWDLQRNIRDVRTFQVRHWRDTKKGGYALTDERDIYEIVANSGARRKRACIQAVIPTDIFNRALRQCDLTLKSTLVIDEAYIKTLLDAFIKYGVTQEMLEKKIQRRIQALVPAQAIMLRRIYTSIKDGMSDAAIWFEADGAVAEEKTQGGRVRPKAKDDDTKKDGQQQDTPAAEVSANRVAGVVSDVEGAQTSQPQAGGDAGKTLSEGQLTTIMAELEIMALGTKDLCKAFSVSSIKEIKAVLFPVVMKWIANPDIPT